MGIELQWRMPPFDSVNKLPRQSRLEIMLTRAHLSNAAALTY